MTTGGRPNSMPKKGCEEHTAPAGPSSEAAESVPKRTQCTGDASEKVSARVWYEPEAYEALQQLTNGLARLVLEAAREIALRGQPETDGSYRIRVPHIRQALVQALATLYAQKPEESPRPE